MITVIDKIYNASVIILPVIIIDWICKKACIQFSKYNRTELNL